MKVSVVIPTYNRRQSLAYCLSSLAAQSFPAEEYEIIIVADGCTDDTVEFLRSFMPTCSVRWFAQSNQGAPAAQNFGVAAAIGDIVIFVDDDCLCDPGLVAAHSDAHARVKRSVVVGTVLMHPDSPFGTIRDLKEELADAEFARASSGEARRSDIMLCANSSVARSALRDCVFDPTYKRMHDVEAGLRLWDKGFRPHFAPGAIAYELFTKSVSEVFSDSRYEGKYEVILSANHPQFKSMAGIMRINEGNPVKRVIRKWMALHPVASEFALRPVNRLAEALRTVPSFSSLAKRVLRARVGLQHLRGAIQEAGSWKKLEELFGKRTPVIMYHNVGSPHHGEYPGLTTPIQEFEAQVRFLSKMGYQGIRPSEWLRWRDGGGNLPNSPVMLVFDDAYADACRNAFPILERYGFVAACMVVTRCIGSTNRWDEEAGRPTFQLMSESEILEWAQRGIEFGGHTCHHPALPLETDECVEQEIARCKQDLTELLREAPVSFAYPFGGVSDAAQSALRKHFQLAFTSWPGVLHLGTSPYLVPRISFLPGETRFAMWCRLRLGKNPFEVLRNRWRMLVRRINTTNCLDGPFPDTAISARINNPSTAIID